MADSELGDFPSAASPLAAMGLDPDEVRANPDLLARLTNRSAYQPTPNLSAVAAGATGGAGDTQTPPATQTSTPASPTDPHGYAMAGLAGADKARQDAAQAAGAVQTETPEDVKRLQSQEEALQPKTPLWDATGNMRPEYKPTAGQKFLRGLRSGAIGFVTGGIPGAAVGAIEPQDIRGGTAYNAPNKTYERAEQKRTDQLGATQSNLEQARKNWEDANKARQAQAQEYGKVAGLAKDEITGATGVINAENKPETEANKTNAKLELTDKEFTQRSGQADRLGLRGTQRALYIANGKLPDPRQPAEGEVALAAATKAFIKQNGREPQTLDEINSVASAARGSLGKGDGSDKAEAANLRAAAQHAAKRLQDLQSLAQHTYGEGKQKLQQQIDDAQDEYDELQARLKGSDTATPTPGAPTQPIPPVPPPAAGPSILNQPGATLTAPTAPTPAPAPAPATKPKPAPDGTKVKLKDGTIQVKRNGKWVNE